jgi:hypothetical protein
LRYEWGLASWGGDGEFFHLTLTRQLVLNGVDEDENIWQDIWQLSLDFQFEPDGGLRQLGSGVKECPSASRGAVDYFERFVRDSVPFRTVTNRIPTRVQSTHECVG